MCSMTQSFVLSLQKNKKGFELSFVSVNIPNLRSLHRRSSTSLRSTASTHSNWFLHLWGRKEERKTSQNRNQNLKIGLHWEKKLLENWKRNQSLTQSHIWELIIWKSLLSGLPLIPTYLLCPPFMVSNWLLFQRLLVWRLILL